MNRALKGWARDLGFDAVGVTRPGAIAGAAARLREFLKDGRHGTMTWMETHADRRESPLALWPAAKSAIVLAMSYTPSESPLLALTTPARGAISAYAKGRDYHDVLKSRLKDLAQRIEQTAACEVKVFVDTAPLMEKPLAAAAGIGWQGKHTNLVSREHGSWLFLGVILTTADIAPDEAEVDHCGSCSRCLDICPTNAFPAPYQLDARRCVAYLTIEHKGHIDRDMRAPIGNRIFGCDDCLAVCPWNKFAAESRETKFKGGPATNNPPLEDVLCLDDTAFRKAYAGTPLKRTGRDRFIRNALIAAGNSANPRLLPHVEPLLRDANPVVRAMAVWALGRLASDAHFADVQKLHLPEEQDEAVRQEWITR